jgi:hypothetical protein
MKKIILNFLKVILISFLISCNQTTISYIITSDCSSGGTIDPSGECSVLSGDDQIFVITPDEGYEISSLLIDSINKPVTSTYKFSNVEADHSIYVGFSKKNLNIIASASIGGTISPSGTTVVAYNESKEFIFTPNAGYIITQVIIDGVDIGNPSSYLFSNITTSHTISVVFSKTTFKIYSSAGSGGIINPSGEIIVDYGKNQAFSIVADSDYLINDVMIDDESNGAKTNYTFENVTKDHTITASFKKKQLSILVSDSSIDFDSQYINESITKSFSIQNNGTSSSRLTGNITISGDSCFKIKSSTTSFSLSQSETNTFEIEFTPSDDKNYNAIISITHNASNETSPIPVNITGAGCYHIWEGYASKSTHVVSSSINTNYYSNDLVVGGNPINNTYLQFNISSIPSSANIEVATLVLYQKGASGNFNIRIGWINAAWDEKTITYSNAPSINAYSYRSFGIYSSANLNKVSFGITKEISKIVSENNSNGIGLFAVDGSVYNYVIFGDRFETTSQRPKLTIYYYNEP